MRNAAIFTLAITLVVLPPGHAIASAIPVAHELNVSTYYETDSSMGRPGTAMAADEPTPSCYPAATQTTWFSVHSSIAGSLYVLAYADAEFGIQALTLYRGSTFADLIEVGCAVDPQPFGLGVVTQVAAGETLYAQVVASGSFSMRATMYPSSAVDQFSSAERLTLGYTANAWTTEGASLEPGEPLACGGARTAWLTYVPQHTAVVTFMILATTNDVLALYRGTSLANLTALGCGELNTYINPPATPLTLHEMRITRVLEHGATYYLQIADTSGLGSPFAMSVFEGEAVLNDAPERALALGQESTFIGTTLGAFSEPIWPMCGFQFGTVWYRFTASTSGALEVTMESLPTAARRNFMPDLAIYQASTRDVLSCGTDTQQSVTVTTPVRAGDSYLIAAMSNGFPGDYRIHWTVR
jgi:hypothetical protein